MTHKYYEIHAINSVKAIGLVILSGYNHRVQRQSLCGSEVTRKIKTVGNRWGHVPQCP